VFMDWVAGIDANVGAVPISRPLVGPNEDDWCVYVARHYPTKNPQPGRYCSLEEAVRAWERQPKNGYIRIQDNGLYSGNRGPLLIRLEGRTLRIEAETTGHPCVGRTIRAHGTGGHISLHGLVIDGGLSLAGVVQVDMVHCTIKSAITAEAAAELKISLRNVLAGPIMLPERGSVIRMDTCIVDGRGGAAVGGLVSDTEPGPSGYLYRSTFLGTVDMCEISEALDCLFIDSVQVLDTHVGVFDHCAFPADSVTPTRAGCIVLPGPFEGSRSASEKPVDNFVAHSLNLGQPGYLRGCLRSKNPIESAASNGSEIGVYNMLFSNRRMHMLHRLLVEFLPLGWSANIQVSQ
jgi:hypothetical protein